MDDYGAYFGNDYDAYNTYDYGGGGDFSGAYDYGMPDYDYSAWLPPAPEPAYTGTSDVLRGYGPSYSDPYLSNLAADPSASVASVNPWYSALTVPSGTGAGGGSILDQFLKPQTLLGFGGALSGLIGALAGGGQIQSQGPRPTTAQQANMIRGNQLAETGAAGLMPLQQQQASLLQAIMSGRGLDQNYARAIETAFQPQLGDLYTQAAEMGRRRGFHDAPATSPPGANVLGKGLADIQGQIAQAKIAAMMQIPNLFNAPIQTQGSFATDYLRGAQTAPMQQIMTQPLGTQIGQQIGGALSGVGQVFAQSEAQQRQDQQYQSLLDALRGLRQPSMV